MLELESAYDIRRSQELWDSDVAGVEHLLKPSCEVENRILRKPSCHFPFLFHLSLPSAESITKDRRSI